MVLNNINRKQPRTHRHRWGDGFWQGIGYWRNRTRKAQETFKMLNDYPEDVRQYDSHPNSPFNTDEEEAGGCDDAEEQEETRQETL